MSVTAASVRRATIWFMAFFGVLPLRPTTRGEAGERVPGTREPAPAQARVARTPQITAPIAPVLFGPVAGAILSGLDQRRRSGPVRPDVTRATRWV